MQFFDFLNYIYAFFRNVCGAECAGKQVEALLKAVQQGGAARG